MEWQLVKLLGVVPPMKVNAGLLGLTHHSTVFTAAVLLIRLKHGASLSERLFMLFNIPRSIASLHNQPHIFVSYFHRPDLLCESTSACDPTFLFKT